MNDFTKEELKKIQDAFIAMGAIEQDLDFDLAYKIQSMIDNYIDNHCNHEPHLVLAESGMYALVRCKACGKFYNMLTKD